MKLRSLLLLAILQSAMDSVWAAAADTDAGQSAKAEAGGVAVNIRGDRNVVTVSLADPQVKVIVNRLLATSLRMQKRQSGQDEFIAALGRQIMDVREAVASIVQASRRADADGASQNAVKLLAAGDVEQSRTILEREERLALRQADEAAVSRADSKPAPQPEARRRAAGLATEQGALAALTDPQVAMAAYERARSYEPEDPWPLLKLGDVHMTEGRTSAALESYESARRSLEKHQESGLRDADFASAMAATLLRIGEARVALGNNDAGLADYREALPFAAQSSGNARNAAPMAAASLTGDRAMLQLRIGDLLVVKRDYPAAFNAYRQSIELVESFEQGRAGDLMLAFVLSSAYQKLGDLYSRKADYGAALAEYRKALAIATKLSEADAQTAVWQSNLARIYQRSGNAQLARRDRAAAFTSFRKALGIREELVEKYPRNFGWSQELAFTHMKLGDLQLGSRNAAAAQVEYEQALALYLKLANDDPDNVDRKRRLAVIQRKVGLALNTLGDDAGAIAHLSEALNLSDQLVQRDPGNSDWQTDVAVTLWRLGAVQSGQSIEKRTERLERSVAILSQLHNSGQLAPDDEQFLAAATRELSKLKR